VAVLADQMDALCLGQIGSGDDKRFCAM